MSRVLSVNAGSSPARPQVLLCLDHICIGSGRSSLWSPLFRFTQAGGHQSQMWSSVGWSIASLELLELQFGSLWLFLSHAPLTREKKKLVLIKATFSSLKQTCRLCSLIWLCGSLEQGNCSAIPCFLMLGRWSLAIQLLLLDAVTGQNILTSYKWNEMNLGLDHGGYSLEGGKVQLGAATNRTSHHASFLQKAVSTN